MPITESELLNAIKQLKNKRSSSFDTFTVALIKAISMYIVPVLTHIINLSFNTGIFPERLKLSTVIPIYKKGNSLKLDNLRPISLLSVFSKIFEKMMKVRILNFLDKIHFFNENQYGFRRNKSTEKAIAKVTDCIYASVNKSLKTTGLFIDFRKAFDLVNIDILLLKLEKIGIRGVALNWFKSFLVGRVQQVRIKDCLSTPLTVKSGVPQPHKGLCYQPFYF